ncbi:hypothetical protein PISMIDRAFT_672161 [Pisolithus microcarpus 441]|uniref:Uncharacterized protein n=1 Tax=Pisolithus microcarpus 441 TaxID=765257 RepID=A0A0C9ZU69_9AGAM|nr:hypothetical protein BKA83DRAFT_672161 [Pisolithus microcarpus]KIK29469.1 hypothetical protein PISMIDRAFT_672161 [Pisolithus microcarpus 441]
MLTSDARDPSREVKLSPPRSWRVESTDAFGSIVMFIAGITMVTKNRYLVWPVLVLAISNALNQHPLRRKDGGSSAWTNLAMAIFALIISHLPMFAFTDPRTGGIRFS